METAQNIDSIMDSMKKPLSEKGVNIIASYMCKRNEKSSFLDSENIFWKWVDDRWVGKRSVYTFDFRSCWLEETTLDNIKSWWCGKEADYTEIFTR